MLLEFYDERELYVANKLFKKTDKRKITFESGNNESEIDLKSYLMLKQQICGNLLEMEFGRYVMSFVGRRKSERMEINNGRMKK